MKNIRRDFSEDTAGAGSRMMQEEGRFNRGSEKALSVRRLNREILMRSEVAEEGRRERTRSDDVALEDD